MISQEKKAAPLKKMSLERLKSMAFSHLQRFATTEYGLRQVLERRLQKAAERETPTNRDWWHWRQWVEQVIVDCKKYGFLNDQEYARSRTQNLHRQGNSFRMIQHKLREKGLDQDLIADHLTHLKAERGGDLAAARVYVRKRRLGLHRPPATRQQNYEKDMARLGRAGFSYETAKKALTSLEDLE